MPRVITWALIMTAAPFAGFILFAHLFGHHGPPDYLQGNQLAESVRSYAEQQSGYHGLAPVSAACVQLAWPAFSCSVAFPDLTEVTYTVTVAADGSSWEVTG